MSETLSAWLVVMFAGMTALGLLRPILLEDVDRTTLRKWATVWTFVVAAAFWLHDYWLFYFLGGILLLGGGVWLGRNALGLYALMVFCLPMLSVEMPGFGFSRSLFELSMPRLAALTLLAPMVIKFRYEIGAARPYGIDRLFVLYFAYGLLLYATRTESTTDLLRSLLLILIDALLPFFVISRLCTDRKAFNALVAAFVLGGTSVAIVGLIEVAKNWLVYKSLYKGLHIPEFAGLGYELIRGGLLRASALFASPIVNGLYLIFVIALCMFPGAQHSRRRFTGRRMVVMMLLLMALFGTLSRGPMLGAAVFFLLFALSTKGISRTFIGGVAVLAVALAVTMVSGSDRFSSLLGLGDSKDYGNVTYRAQLFEASLAVIERNWAFGSEDFLKAPELQPLRQGQGLIDIVNSYLQVTLQTGVVGLALFVATFFAAMRKPRGGGIPSFGWHGWHALRALVISFMVVIATVSRIDYVPYLYAIVLALIVGWRRALEDAGRSFGGSIGSKKITG